MSEQNAASVPSNALNARVAPFVPNETLEPRSEGPIVAKPPTPESRFVTKNTDYPDSTKPSININVEAIRDSVARTLAKHDRDVAVSNGIEDWKLDAANLNASVRKGELTAQQAEAIFKSVHPTISPEQLGGRK